MQSFLEPGVLGHRLLLAKLLIRDRDKIDDALCPLSLRAHLLGHFGNHGDPTDVISFDDRVQGQLLLSTTVVELGQKGRRTWGSGMGAVLVP